MTKFEYKVLPAPARGEKVKGVKKTEGRFAYTLMEIMNELGAEGWEYLRADTLPCEERVGLTGRKTTFQNMLVFRRALVEETAGRGARLVSDVNGADVEAGPQVADEEHANVAVSRRVVSTLTSRPLEGVAPALRTTSEVGAAPKIGTAMGNGADQTEDTGVAAE